MADPLQNVKVSADISDLQKAASGFVAALGMQNEAIQGLIVKSLEYNTTSKKAYAQVEQQINAHQKLVAWLKLTKDGWVVTTGAVKQNTTAEEAAAKATKKLADEQARLAKERAKAAAEYKRMIDVEANKQANSSILGKSLGPADFFRIAEATLFKSALTGVINALRDGIGAAREFQIQVSLIRTVSQEAQLSTDSWSKGLTDVANKLGFNVVDVAKSAYDAIQTQVVVGAQTFQFLEAAGQLARTTGADLKNSTDLLASTIQGFKLSIVEADRAAAILFKTVELGRIEVNELSTTFGKVAPTAGLLGIRLEEVSAAYATLTRQGIKTADASTLVINIISKLAKPTEEMKKLLGSWGFESGQAAVKTLGFVEVLRRLEKTTNSNIGELAQLFNELRGLRGAAGLTSAFQDFEVDLKKIDDADKTYKKAIEIRAESHADTLTKFTNAARNTFIGVYGSEIVDILGNFVTKLGQGDQVAKTFANTILLVGGGLTAVKVGAAAFTAIQGSLIASQIAAQRTAFATAQAQMAYNGALAAGLPIQQAATVQQIAFNKAKADFVPTETAANAARATAIGQMAVLGVATAGVIGVYAALNREITTNITNMGNFNRIFEETQRLSPNTTENLAQKDIKNFSERVNATFTAPLKLTAEQLKLINKEVEVNEEQVKESTQKFAVAYKNFFDGAKDAVKELNKEVTNSRREIERSVNAIAKTQETVDDVIRKTQFKYANDIQKTQLYQQEVQRLTNEAQNLYDLGDEESINKAREKVKDIVNLIDEAKQHQVELDRRALENAYRADPSLGRDGPPILSVSTLDLQRALAATVEFQRQNEERIQSIHKERIGTLKEQVKIEEDRQRKLETAVKNFTEFNIMRGDKVRDEFLTDGKIDPEKVKNELRKLQNDIYKNIGPGQNANDVIKMTEALLARVSNIEKEATLRLNKEKVVKNQEMLTKQRDDFIKNFKEIKDFEAKFSAQVFAPQGIMDKLKQDGQTLKDLTSQQWDRVEKIFQVDPEKRGIRVEVTKLQKELAEKDLAYQKAVDNLKNNAAKGPGGQLLPRDEDVTNVKLKFDEVYNTALKIATLLRKTGMEDPNLFGVNKDGKFLRLDDIKNDFLRQYDAVREGNKTVEDKDNNLRQLEEQLQKFKTDAVDPLLKTYPELKRQIEAEVAPLIQGFYQKLLGDTDLLIESVKQLQIEYSKLPKGSGGTKISANIDVNPEGLIGTDQAEYLATGGYVHPGKAKGTDTIPAWLSPGEFVINAAQTKKFYTQLMDINRGVQPRYYARGGYVTTNVGDVHVHMESSTTPSASRIARQMGEELRREIRRGNVKLR